MTDERTRRADEEIDRIADSLFNVWEVPESDREGLKSPLLTLLGFFYAGTLRQCDRLMMVYAVDGRLSVEVRGADGEFLIRREGEVSKPPRD